MGSNDPVDLPAVGTWFDLWDELEETHKQLALDDFLSALKTREWEGTSQKFWGRLAKAVHFREQTLRSMDVEKLRVRLLLHLKSVMTSSAWSLFFFLYWRKHHGDMMKCFLDGLDIEHDGHGIYRGAIKPPPQAQLDATISDVSKRFSATDVRDYIRVLLIREPENWSFLKTTYQDLCTQLPIDSEPPLSATGAGIIPPDTPSIYFPSDEFTTLDRMLIKSIVDTVSDTEGALDSDELEDLISTVIGLNSSRYRTYFHVGFMDTLVPGRALDFEQPEFNDVRREWYLCGALHGLVRKRDAETIKTTLSNRSDDFSRASARPGGPGAAMARTLLNGFIEMGRITEAALLVRGQAGEMVGYAAANGALSKASDLLRDNDLASAGTLLNALDQAQHSLQSNDPRTQAFRRHLARRLGQYHQAQGNFKQATALFERLQKEDEPEQASDIITDLGLVRSGRKSLVEVKLPVDREQRILLLEALRRGASLFEQAVRSEETGATNAHYALAMLKYLERNQEQNRASASQLSEQALRHAQEALDGMRLAEAALAYDRLGLTGQCLFIQAVLQMERLDAVDARAAIAAWTQITVDAGTFPLEDIRALIEIAEVVDAEIAVQIAESVWKYRPNGAVELVQFDGVLSRSQYLQDRLMEVARQPTQPRPQQWELWTRLIPILLRAGNIDAAEEGLDALQQLAENEAYARQFVDFLSKTPNYDPAWDERDVKWARIRVARRMGDDQLCGANLRELFFEVRDSNPPQALQIIDLCADWRIDSSHHKDLAARMPESRESSTNLLGLEERLKGGEAVRVLFVGGNEIQERFDQDISEILRREWPGIEIVFRHTGWSSNWGRELDGLKKEANASDCVVLMTMMRTMLGRKLRTGLSKPWLTCAATGRSGIQNSIREAARIGLQTRTGARRT